MFALNVNMFEKTKPKKKEQQHTIKKLNQLENIHNNRIQNKNQYKLNQN